jgi:hypothetical protein
MKTSCRSESSNISPVVLDLEMSLCNIFLKLLNVCSWNGMKNVSLKNRPVNSGRKELQ